MNDYSTLLNIFKGISDELDDLIQKFPPEKREEIVFDKWSLKNVVSHLNHWMIHDIDCLENLLRGSEPYWEPDVEDFNQKGVEVRKNKSWDEIYSEFLELKEKMVTLYKELPVDLRAKKFWTDRHENPTEFLKEDINHWRDEHVVSLNNFYKNQ